MGVVPGPKGLPAISRRARVRDRIMGEGLVGTFIIVFLAFGITNPIFLSSDNLAGILRQSAETGIGAAGQMLVILISGIDLSVGSVLALSGLAAAIVATQFGLPALLALVAALAVGVATGAMNGIGVTKLRVAPIIVTLASMTFVRGLVYVWSGGFPIYKGLPPLFPFIGGGYIGRVVPVPVLILLLVFAAVWFLLNRTVIGTHLYAIGGNLEATRLAGVKVDRLRVGVYALCGGLSALAGVMVLGRINSAQPTAGLDFGLDTITVVVLGGVSVFGGKGSILKVFIAALLLSVITNGMVIVGLSANVQLMVKGLILMIAVSLDVYGSGRARR